LKSLRREAGHVIMRFESRNLVKRSDGGLNGGR
jgi:hypothetical protein